MSTQDIELAAMNSIWNALQTLPDDEAKTRCINWVLDRSGITLGHTQPHIPKPPAPHQPGITTPAAPNVGGADSFEDIIERTEDGRFRVIARDIKAKSCNDAAVRLVHLLLFINEKLDAQAKTSSKKFIVPVLTEWRAYDPNTRTAIKANPGIKRDGDILSLDVHSRREAQAIIAQIRDESVKGTWSASAAKNRKSTKKGKGAAAK